MNKILLLLTIFYSIHSLALRKIDDNAFSEAHFVWNEENYLSSTGNLTPFKKSEARKLIRLSGSKLNDLKIIDYFYLTQKKLIKHNIEVIGINVSNSGNLKVFLKDNKIIKFQDYKIDDQLKRLNIFLSSDGSNKLITNFQSIDLRYKNKIAINYLNG